MYVVEVDHFIDTATIHLVGGCILPCAFEVRLDKREVDWSYPISSLREARDFALLSRKRHTTLCEFCEQSSRFGA